MIQETTNPGAPQVTSAKEWKGKTSQGTPLVVPSGNTCLVRTPGMQVFVKQGMIPNSLMPIVRDAMSKGRAPKETDFDLDTNPELLSEMMELMDAIAMYCVVQPQLEPTPVDANGKPLPPAERNPDILYVDDVDFNDKLFIFQYAVGGTADLTKFRQELAEHVEDLPAS